MEKFLKKILIDRALHKPSTRLTKNAQKHGRRIFTQVLRTAIAAAVAEDHDEWNSEKS